MRRCERAKVLHWPSAARYKLLHFKLKARQGEDGGHGESDRKSSAFNSLTVENDSRKKLIAGTSNRYLRFTSYEHKANNTPNIRT